MISGPGEKTEKQVQWTTQSMKILWRELLLIKFVETLSPTERRKNERRFFCFLFPIKFLYFMYKIIKRVCMYTYTYIKRNELPKFLAI